MIDVLVSGSDLVLDKISLVALTLVVAVGLPHGAFDGAIARYLGYSQNWRGLIYFILLYLILAMAVIMFWIWQPGFALGLFLLMSALHFGYGDATAVTRVAKSVQIAAHGGVAVFGISLFHLEEVIPLFSALTYGDVAFAVSMTKIFPFFIIPVVVLYFILAIQNTILRQSLIELAFLVLVLGILPPLVGFALYFCIIHTGRHMQHIWRCIQSHTTPRQILLQAAIFAIASWLFGLIMLFWLDSGNVSQDLLQVIFIGLAALTVPHMILVDWFFRQKNLKGAIV